MGTLTKIANGAMKLASPKGEADAQPAVQQITQLTGEFNPLAKIKKGAAIVSDISAALKDRPEYLVQYAKGKEASKLYGGFEDKKTGQVTFKEVTQAQIDQLARTGKVPEVKTFQALTTELAQQNTPGKLTDALSVAKRVDERLVAAGQPHSAGADVDLQVKKGQKPAAIAATMDQNRTTLVSTLEEQLKLLNDTKGFRTKDHPELGKISEGSNPPITIREAMKTAITNTLTDLKPAEGLSNAVDGFKTQIIDAPVAAPAAKPAAPSLGNF